MPTKGLHKFKFERQFGRTILNPMVAALDRVGVRSSLVVVELETHRPEVGRAAPGAARRSGRRHRRLGDLGGKVSRSATAITMRAMESDPISVRITYTD